jgi:quercetin dioxygenase-like cupin family protein
MKQLLWTILIVSSLFSGVLLAQSTAPIPMLSDSFRWVSPPSIPGMQYALILGAEQKPGLYLFRVKLASGTRMPPHTHPDERNTTVLAGTIYVGFGETFDESKLVAIPTGAVFVVPANVPHYVWAKDGETTYQESGVGPTGTTMIRR